MSNTEFYQQLSTDPFEDYQKIIINTLKELQSEDLIDKETVDTLTPINARPASTYSPKYTKRTTLDALLFPQLIAIQPSYLYMLITTSSP